MARREEWQEQKKLARLLDKWLDPACTFWTATDPVASSAFSGAIRKQRGVKPDTPEHLILHRGKLVTIEMKSRQGRCRASQREARLAIPRRGGRLVGLPLGAGGDVGAAQVGRDVPHDRPRGRHGRALAAARTAGVGGAEARPARAATTSAGLGARGGSGGDCRVGGGARQCCWW